MLRKSAKIIVPLLILAVAVSITRYLQATKPVVEASPFSEKVWTVAGITATPVSLRPKIRLFGEIVSGRTIDLRPQVAGKIIDASPNLVEGGVVRQGEVLVDIDRFDYDATLRQRQAERNEARGKLRELNAELSGAVALLGEDRTQLALRRKDTDRRKKLRGSGAGTAKAADDARLASSEAEQRLIERKKEINRLKAAIEQQKAAIDRLDVSVSKAERDLEETRILAPSDGFVFSVETAEGKWLNVGDSVARLIDADRLEAKFHMSRTQFRRLTARGGFKGRPAKVIWRGRGKAAPYSAFIDRVGSEVDARTGGVDLFAKIEAGGADTILRPGAFVEVYIDDKEFIGVFRMPANAIYDGDKIYAVVNGRLEERLIKVVTRLEGDVLVSGDVGDGDMIAVTRLPEAASGLQVLVK